MKSKEVLVPCCNRINIKGRNPWVLHLDDLSHAADLYYPNLEDRNFETNIEAFQTKVQESEGNQHTKWPGLVPKFVEIHNLTPHSSTGYPPVEILKGFSETPNEWLMPLPRLTVKAETREEKMKKIWNRLTSCAAKRKRKYDRGVTNEQKYNVGDLVLIRNHAKSSATLKQNKETKLKNNNRKWSEERRRNHSKKMRKYWEERKKDQKAG
ncbi:uncharacterized protein LOC124737632, partial [Schistocerca piceifrons]|uniref:uncharacterized protein LOC124737632 n=2 Tax=Schistocerca piceifrons TaxID=274613 RepID=UPI001F5EA661